MFLNYLLILNSLDDNISSIVKNYVQITFWNKSTQMWNISWNYDLIQWLNLFSWVHH